MHRDFLTDIVDTRLVATCTDTLNLDKFVGVTCIPSAVKRYRRSLHLSSLESSRCD
jgi:hypothetical protein